MEIGSAEEPSELTIPANWSVSFSLDLQVMRSSRLQHQHESLDKIFWMPRCTLVFAVWPYKARWYVRLFLKILGFLLTAV